MQTPLLNIKPCNHRFLLNGAMGEMHCHIRFHFLVLVYVPSHKPELLSSRLQLRSPLIIL